MTILVTGGAGYIGSHMCWLLQDRNEPYVVLDDLSTGRKEFLPEDSTLIIGNVGDQDLLDQVMGEHSISAVIHFAGSVVVPESVENPLKYYANNTANSRVLIEACVRNTIPHFIFSSTAAVYGLCQDPLVSEDTPLAPSCPYATSKLMTEWMLRDAGAAHDLNYVVLRYFNVAGADPARRTGQSTRNATHLIKRATQTALGQWPELQIYGSDFPTKDGTGVRDYIHVADLVEAHMQALSHLRGDGESDTLNCGYGRGFSVLDVIGVVEQVTERPLPVKRAARRPGDGAQIVADNSRLVARFGWKPEYDDLEVIVRTAFAWEEHLATLDGS